MIQIGFGAADGATGLKMLEQGVPKEQLALLAIPMSPLQIVLPLFIAKYTTGPNPMGLYVKAIPVRYNLTPTPKKNIFANFLK